MRGHTQSSPASSRPRADRAAEPGPKRPGHGSSYERHALGGIPDEAAQVFPASQGQVLSGDDDLSGRSLAQSNEPFEHFGDQQLVAGVNDGAGAGWGGQLRHGRAVAELQVCGVKFLPGHTPMGYNGAGVARVAAAHAHELVCPSPVISRRNGGDELCDSSAGSPGYGRLFPGDELLYRGSLGRPVEP